MVLGTYVNVKGVTKQDMNALQMVVWHIGHRAHLLSSVCLRPQWVV